MDVHRVQPRLGNRLSCKQRSSSNHGQWAVLRSSLVGPDPGLHYCRELSAICRSVELGGVRGWLLPTIQELMTLWDEAGYVLSNQDFHMPAGHPFSTANLRWWIATTSDANAFFAWAAGYSATYEPITFNKENNAFAYAVC